MIIFASLLTLSTFASDNTYYIDSANTMQDCQINLDSAHTQYQESPTEFLLEQNVREDVKNILGAKWECVAVIVKDEDNQ